MSKIELHSCGRAGVCVLCHFLVLLLISLWSVIVEFPDQNKTCLKRSLKNKRKAFVFKTDNRLMQVRSLAKFSVEVKILQNTFDLH